MDSPDTYTDFHKRFVRALICSILSSLTILLQFQLKPFGDYGEKFLHRVRRNVADSGIDVDIKIEACGVCGSDVHTVSGKPLTQFKFSRH